MYVCTLLTCHAWSTIFRYLQLLIPSPPFIFVWFSFLILWSLWFPNKLFDLPPFGLFFSLQGSMYKNWLIIGSPVALRSCVWWLGCGAPASRGPGARPACPASPSEGGAAPWRCWRGPGPRCSPCPRRPGAQAPALASPRSSAADSSSGIHPPLLFIDNYQHTSASSTFLYQSTKADCQRLPCVYTALESELPEKGRSMKWVFSSEPETWSSSKNFRYSPFSLLVFSV